MRPRQLPPEKRQQLRQELLQLQALYDLTYRQLQRYARRSWGLQLSRSGMFHFLQ